MGQLVNAIGADIVMLQETAVPLSDQRLASLHDNCTVRFANDGKQASACHTTPNSQGVAIAVNKRHTTCNFKIGTGTSAGRIASCDVFVSRTESGKNPLRVNATSAYLPACTTDASGATTPIRTAQSILSQIQYKPKNSKVDLLLCGADLNCVLDKADHSHRIDGVLAEKVWSSEKNLRIERSQDACATWQG